MTTFAINERVKDLRNEALWSLHAMACAAAGMAEAPSTSADLDAMAMETLYQALELKISSKADAIMEEIAGGDA